MKEQTIRNILAEELFGTRLCESVEDQEILEAFYEGIKPLFEKFLWGEPISVPELRKLLRKSIVNFEFIKLDGEVRPAKGTTMLKYIPKEDHPKGIRPSSDAVATFFDLDKEAWRSVSKKSKEIVLKKDEEKDRPIVIVKDKEKGLKKKDGEIEQTGQEPIDELEVGDIRFYLNRNNRDIAIKITRMDDDGSLYAETLKEGTPFKIPAERVRNIGEKLSQEEIDAIRRPRAKAPIIPATPIIQKKAAEPELKPVTPTTPEGIKKEVIELKPIESIETKEPPEEIEDKEDAEELLK
jgi:hypothetical protein